MTLTTLMSCACGGCCRDRAGGNEGDTPTLSSSSGQRCAYTAFSGDASGGDKLPVAEQASALGLAPSLKAHATASGVCGFAYLVVAPCSPTPGRSRLPVLRDAIFVAVHRVRRRDVWPGLDRHMQSRRHCQPSLKAFSRPLDLPKSCRPVQLSCQAVCPKNRKLCKGAFVKRTSRTRCFKNRSRLVSVSAASRSRALRAQLWQEYPDLR